MLQVGGCAHRVGAVGDKQGVRFGRGGSQDGERRLHIRLTVVGSSGH